MPSSALLTKEQVAELTGRSTRWVEQQRETLQPIAGATGRNGKPVPLYDISKLPAEWQKTWARAQRQQVVEIAPAQAPLSDVRGLDAGQLALSLTAPTGPNLSIEDRGEAEKRFGVIEPLIDREKYHLLYMQFPQRRELMAYLSQMHGVKVRTLYHWLSLWELGGLPALVRKDRSDKGTSRAMNDAAKTYLLSIAFPRKGAYGVLRVAEAWRAYGEESAWREAHFGRALDEFSQDKYAAYLDADGRMAPQALLPKVSYETFRVWFNRIPEMMRSMGRDGADAYRNSQEIITHRDYMSIKPMDWVVFDHRVLDMFCLVRERGGWKLVRPWLTACIDMRTRKWLAWAIVETPSSDSIATVLKKLFIQFGLPGELYWDNGKDFRCQWFEGRARRERRAERIAELDPTWRGVLGTLGIRVRHAIAYNARAKVIEANFNRISNVDRTLPEWAGHKPGARPERFDGLLKQHEAWIEDPTKPRPFRTIEEVAELYSKVLRDLNERPVEGEGMRTVTPTGHGWMTPGQCWDQLIGKVERRSVPVDVLHMCFNKRRDLTVKHSEVSMTLDGRPYYYRPTDNGRWMGLLNGKKVQLAYDPLDLSEGAIYDETRFRGLVSCVELRHMGEQKFIEDEKERRHTRREVKKVVAAITRIAPVATLEERLARRAEVLPARTDVPRVELPAELPAPVADQAAAVREERAFRFDQAESAIEVTPAAVTEADDEFDFFGK